MKHLVFTWKSLIDLMNLRSATKSYHDQFRPISVPGLEPEGRRGISQNYSTLLT